MASHRWSKLQQSYRQEVETGEWQEEQEIPNPQNQFPKDVLCYKLVMAHAYLYTYLHTKKLKIKGAQSQRDGSEDKGTCLARPVTWAAFVEPSSVHSISSITNIVSFVSVIHQMNHYRYIV